MQQSTPAEYEACNRSGHRMGSKVSQLGGSYEAFTLRKSLSQHSYSVRLEGKPWLPLDGAVPSIIQTLLCWGERRIVLDLAGVPEIDAAGVGELVRAYNVARAGDGALRIANANRRVREILERVGLFDCFDANAAETEDPDRRDDRDICA
jgi:anti-anti-sigma factor